MLISILPQGPQSSRFGSAADAREPGRQRRYRFRCLRREGNWSRGAVLVDGGGKEVEGKREGKRKCLVAGRVGGKGRKMEA